MIGMKTRSRYKRNALQAQDTFGDRIFLAIVYVFLLLILVVVLYPLMHVVASSLSSPAAVQAGKVSVYPVDITLKAYEAVFTNKQIINGFLNSLFYMVAGTVVNLAMTMLAAFPLSRKEFVGRGAITTIFVITMYFSGGLVPTYMLINSLGLIDSRLVLIIPGAMSVWFVLICRTFIKTNIPDEMYEAAQIDGCSDFRFLLRIILPLSGAILAVLALYYGIGHWNAYFGAMIYLKSPSKYPLQLVLRSILVMNKIDPTMEMSFQEIQAKQGLSNLLKYAVIVVSSLPVMLMYPFVQRYFVKGVMIGAIKG